MKKVQLIPSLFLAAVLSAACFADSIPSESLTTGAGDLGGVSGFQFTATLTETGTNGFSLDLQVKNITGTGTLAAATGTLTDFSINLLGGGNTPITATSWTLPTNWTEANGAIAANNAPSCGGGTGAASWLCAYGATPLNLAAGQYFDFKFSGTYSGTITPPFDLKANGSIGGTALHVSSNMAAPEPSAALLLGGGLSAIALLSRRRKSRA